MIRRVHCSKIWNDAEKLKKAFLDANFPSSVRRSLLARNRRARREYLVGETVYYWREKGENKEYTGLDVYHWHGPGVVGVRDRASDESGSLFAGSV